MGLTSQMTCPGEGFTLSAGGEKGESTKIMIRKGDLHQKGRRPRKTYAKILVYE